MNFEHDNVPTTQFQNKSASVTRSIRPLLFLEYSIVDKATSTGDEFSDFTRTIEANIQWISRVDVKEFVELRRELLRESRNPDHYDGIEEVKEEDIENILSEEHVSAFVDGSSGSNVLDYDSLAQKDFEELKDESNNLSDEIDWGQLFHSERSNRDRNEVKEWIEYKRKKERSRRYDTARFCQIRDSDFYPDRIGNLGFGFIGAPEVAYWNGVGGLIGFTPEAEERNTGEREKQIEYQEEMDDEYSHLSCNLSSYQRIERNENEELEIRHDKSLGVDLSLERFGWYFERTVPDDYLSRACDIHGYESNEEVVKAVYNLVESKLDEVAKEYDLRKDGNSELPSFRERISGEVSFDKL